MARKDSYTMDEQLNIAKRASKEITTFLEHLPYSISVMNVEDDRAYQKRDIDLLWKYEKNGRIVEKRIEVKGDTYHKTGNIFVEVISNVTKKTPGCFMYTEADYIFYYFIDSKELNIIKMDDFRRWWEISESRFRPVYLKTRVRKDEEIYYYTMGKLVKKEILLNELNMKQLIIPDEMTEDMNEVS